jgi:hypothetical protein
VLLVNQTAVLEGEGEGGGQAREHPPRQVFNQAEVETHRSLLLRAGSTHLATQAHQPRNHSNGRLPCTVETWDQLTAVLVLVAAVVVAVAAGLGLGVVGRMARNGSDCCAKVH